MTKIDIHVHTSGASTCSRMTAQEYVDWFRREDLPVVTLTNHGDLSENELVCREAGRDGRLFIPGIEISTRLGDFLIYPLDEYYVKHLHPMEIFPPRVDRKECAVIWAHPAIGGGMSGAKFDISKVEEVLPYIDAIEVLNGNLVYHSLDMFKDYNHIASDIAYEHGLPATGGSDSHHRNTLMRCYTVFEEEPKDVEHFISLIKDGRVKPGRFKGSFDKKYSDNDKILRELYDHMDAEWPDPDLQSDLDSD